MYTEQYTYKHVCICVNKEQMQFMLMLMNVHYLESVIRNSALNTEVAKKKHAGVGVWFGIM